MLQPLCIPTHLMVGDQKEIHAGENMDLVYEAEFVIKSSNNGDGVIGCKARSCIM